MDEPEVITRIREENNRLAALLADPHPDLVAWVEAVGRTIKNLAKLVGII